MRLRVASYNIRKAVGLDRRRDPARILAILNDIAADIVLLQEADKRLGQRPSALPRFLISRETDYRVADLARTDVSIGWHGNAVLVRPGLDLTDAGHIDLPGLEPRGAVFVTVSDRLTVVGTHLGLLGRWRRRQLAAISQHLGDPARSVVAGDFNEWSRRSGFEPWDGHLAVTAPGATFPASRPMGHLDRFAHGEEVILHAARVVRTSATRVASDHLPVVADISVRG